MCSTMRLIFNLHSTFNALFNIQLRIQHSTIHFIFNSLFTHSIIYSTISTIYSTFNFNFTLGTRGFSRVRREFSVLARKAEATNGEAARKDLWHGAVLFTVIYTPIRLEVSNCDHVDRHVKKCPTNHIILRKTSWSLKFIDLREIMTKSRRNSPWLM